MSTTLSPTSSTTVDTQQYTQQHPPQPLDHVGSSVRRVGLADRVALRLGLALVTWSRRPRRALPTHEQSRQRAEREWRAQRELLLTVPRR